MATFTEINPFAIQDNPFTLIGKDWMLITAGETDSMNTMTASWGGLGVLWNKPVSYCFVRPTRHTYGFMEDRDFYSLSFFEPSYRSALELCGRVSGRDTDKIADAGLTPCTDREAPYFDEARLVLVCRKLYTQDIDPARFIDTSLAQHYPDADYHRVYVGEVVRVLRRED